MSMTLGEIDLSPVLDILVLLFIGMGPTVALVPFPRATADMDTETRKKVADRMVGMATVLALVLMVHGGLLMKLLQFKEPAL